MDDDGPKYRLEHAANGMATCTRAACKREKVKIARGELRVGTHSFYEPEGRWYMAWRHWGCGTPHQIKGLKELTENDPTKAPGYDRLSPESQEQVRLAFEEERVVDKEFKGIREDLAKNAAKYGGEIRDAVGYAVSVATRAAACRGSDCLNNGTKITKDELRLGISVSFDDEHSSMKYKHWRCISDYDLEQITSLHKDELLDGIGVLPAEYQQAVQATLESGKVIDPPKVEPVKKPKKSRAKKKKSDEYDSDEDDEAVEDTPKPKKSKAKKRKSDEDDSSEDDQTAKDAPKPKRSRKKKVAKDEGLSNEDTEPEYVPKKTRSRSKPMKDVAISEDQAETEIETETRAVQREEIDPAVQKIEAMAAAMREAEAHR